MGPGRLLFLLILPIVLFVGAVIGVNKTLTINDLADCDAVPSAVELACAPADAIVVISGGDTQARTREAIWLYQNDWAPLLIMSGAAEDATGLSNAAAMRNQSTEAGVLQGAIVLDEQARDTAGNAAGVEAIARDRSLSRVIVVTSPYHQRRAALEFTKALGPGVTVLSHSTPDDRYWNPEFWWLNPFSWYLAISELVKVGYVKITS